MPRHQHVEAYATLVLGGAYEQFAYAGRLFVEEGDVILQPTFDCHADLMCSPGLQLIRLPWRADASLGGVFRGVRIDDIRRTALTDADTAREMLEAELAGRQRLPPAEQDWSDRLATDLVDRPRQRIDAWAEAQGLSREHVARRFRATFGVAPTQFRAELNARNTWFRIVGTSDPLSRIATEAGYADQAHMTRAVRALTGAPPARWRIAQSLKTPAHPTAAVED
jgi:AraC-like DNA-binding protein